MAKMGNCNCEHANHFNWEWDGVDGKRKHKPRVGHRYMSATAGEAWAMYVGHVCDDCAETCMKDYLIAEHVCGEGDCHR